MRGESLISTQSIIPVTYAELLAMATGGTLVPCQKYKITDFRTRHTIWGTVEINGSISQDDAFNTPTEPLVVTAITVSTIGAEATSEDYPDDIIHYLLVDPIHTVHDRGVIVYRKDTRLSISASCDWRTYLYKLWERNLGDAVYSLMVDPLGGQAYQYFKMFDLNQVVKNVSVGASTDNRVPPVVFQAGVNKVIIGDEPDPCVFVGLVYESTIGPCKTVLAYGEVRHSSIYSYARFDQGVDGLTINKVNSGTFWFTGLISNVNVSVTPSVLESEDAFVALYEGDHTDESLGGSLPWSISYGGLSNRVTSGTLIPGQKYRITDRNDAMVEAISTAEYIPSSNCVASMDWNTSMDMAYAWDMVSFKDIRYAGIVNLISNGTLSSSSLINFNTNHPVTFKAPTGSQFTFIHTDYANINADGQILSQSDIVLNGNYSDSVMLERVSITNGNGTFNVLKKVGSTY